MWLAFEVVKCAERQSLALADDLDWAIRVAFFAQSRCISLRHVLLELAQQVDLDRERFADDFDRGVTKYQVLQEAQEGWNYHLSNQQKSTGATTTLPLSASLPMKPTNGWSISWTKWSFQLTNLPPNNYSWHYAAKARFTAFKRRYIVSMVNGCKHGISGETGDSKRLAKRESRAFSSLLQPDPSVMMHLLFFRRVECF